MSSVGEGDIASEATFVGLFLYDKGRLFSEKHRNDLAQKHAPGFLGAVLEGRKSGSVRKLSTPSAILKTFVQEPDTEARKAATAMWRADSIAKGSES